MQERNHFLRKLASPRKYEEKIKSRMGNSSRNADKKSMKTGQNDRTKERRLNM